MGDKKKLKNRMVAHIHKPQGKTGEDEPVQGPMPIAIMENSESSISFTTKQREALEKFRSFCEETRSDDTKTSIRKFNLWINHNPEVMDLLAHCWKDGKIQRTPFQRPPHQTTFQRIRRIINGLLVGGLFLLIWNYYYYESSASK